MGLRDLTDVVGVVDDWTASTVIEDAEDNDNSSGVERSVDVHHGVQMYEIAKCHGRDLEKRWNSETDESPLNSNTAGAPSLPPCYLHMAERLLAELLRHDTSPSCTVASIAGLVGASLRRDAADTGSAAV